MLKTRSVRIFISIIIFIFLGAQVYAQTGSISTPYSAFGIGYLSPNNNARSMSMGGISIGTRDYFAVNYMNPASYTAFDTTSFLFEGAVAGSYINMKSDDFTESGTNASLSHLLFGFPITKFLKSSIGLVPYSTVGYSVNSTENNEGAGNTLYNYQGKGGISRFYFGAAIQPFKNLSLGFNLSYLFGTIHRSQNISFPDSAYRINTKINNATTVGNIFLDFGIQYFTKLKNNLDLVAGATFNPKQKVSAKEDYFARSYLGSVSGVEIFKDTIKYYNDQPGKMTLPMGFGVGFSLTKKDNWMAGIDYKYGQWQDYQSFNVNDSLVNTHFFNIGGQYIPDYKSTSYANRIDYRVGAKYYKSYLKLRDKDINGFGITFGIGLPLRSLAIRGSRSKINIGVEVGKRGTKENNLIQENYVNAFVGISIYEWWFFKRRYN